MNWTASIAGYGGTKTGNKAFVTTVTYLDATNEEEPITLESTILPTIRRWQVRRGLCHDRDRRGCPLHRRPQRQPQGPAGLHLVRG